MQTPDKDRERYINQIASAAMEDLSYAYMRIRDQSELPVAALAIFTDESGAPIHIMCEYSADGFSRDEPGNYRALALVDGDERPQYACDELVHEVRGIKSLSFQERSRIIIEGLARSVRSFSDSGNFDSALPPTRRLLMLWVHDTFNFADDVIAIVRECNSTCVSEWFATNYCYRN